MAEETKQTSTEQTGIRKIVKESNDNDLAQEYLNEDPKFDDIFGLKPEWEKKVFFNSLEEAWPGIEALEEEVGSSTPELDELFSEVRFLNDMFERQDSKWRTFVCKDEKDGNFVMFHSDIGDTGNYVVQKVKKINLEESKLFNPYFTWELSSLAIGSYKSDSVILLDEFIKSNTPDLRVSMATQYTVSRVKTTELLSFYNPGEDSLFVQNPDLEIKNLFGFLHELAHAKEFNYFRDKYGDIFSKARITLKKDIPSKMELVEEKNLLSSKMAQEVSVKQERRAWVVVASLLKKINDEIQKRGGGLSFGSYQDRRKVLDFAEQNLETYDNGTEVLEDLTSEEIVKFSQYNRGQARKLEDVNKGYSQEEE